MQPFNKTKPPRIYYNKMTYRELLPANQSFEEEPMGDSFYTRFVHHYAKFMMIVGVLGQSVFYLQAYKIFLKESADNISLEGFIISFFSLNCWLIYGFLIRDKVVMFVNIIGVIGTGAVVFAILKYS